MNEDQLAEREALESLYGIQNITYSVSEDCVKGTIDIELDCVKKPIELRASQDGALKSCKVFALSSVLLNFQLPKSYPNESPTLDIVCKWMSSDMVIAVTNKLTEVCKTYEDFPILYYCCDEIMKTVETLLDNISVLDVSNTVYGSQYQKSPHSVFLELQEDCELAAEHRFESQCYDCEVCYENKMGNDCVRFSPCGHIFCKVCVKSFFEVRMNTVQVKPLQCLDDGCDSLCSSRVIRAMLGDEEYDRYERILLDTALSQMSDVVTCARKICQKPVIVSQENHYLASCQFCGFNFCILCRRTYHGIDDCKFTGADKNAIINCWESGSEEEKIKMSRLFGGMEQMKVVVNFVKSEMWIESHSDCCPRCRINIEKNSGCNKMHCTHCNAMFCWLCKAVLDPANPYAHFSADGSAKCFNRLFEGMVEDHDEEVSDEEFFEDFSDGSEDSLDDVIAFF